nr:hypothetical protein [Halorubrum amylolyticum]
MKLAGASVAAAAVPGVVSADAESASDWTAAKTPVDGTLHDVRYTATNPHAVGAGGVLIERTAAGWEIVLRGGVSGNGNGLYGAAVTDDGKRLWMVGNSGAIGEYDVTTGNLVDRSQPDDTSNQFNSVAVTGPAGDADVYVVDDSGLVYYSFANGEEGTWNYLTPGSGAGIPAAEFYDARAGTLIDTNGKVFATDDGTTWNAFGIADADTTFAGLDADAPDDVTVVGGGGSLYVYDGVEWRSDRIAEAGLKDVITGDAGGVAVGGSGTVVEREDGVWSVADTPSGQNLCAVAAFDGDRDYVVGASGTALER